MDRVHHSLLIICHFCSSYFLIRLSFFIYEVQPKILNHELNSIELNWQIMCKLNENMFPVAKGIFMSQHEWFPKKKFLFEEKWLFVWGVISGFGLVRKEKHFLAVLLFALTPYLTALDKTKASLSLVFISNFFSEPAGISKKYGCAANLLLRIVKGLQ